MLFTTMIVALLQRVLSTSSSSSSSSYHYLHHARSISTSTMSRSSTAFISQSNHKISFANIISRHGSTTSKESDVGVDTSASAGASADTSKEAEVEYNSPWNPEHQPPPKSRTNKNRFRQHVNPLARKYQMPTDMIDEEWPNDGTYKDLSLPLHIDVGCGKGGFLLALAEQRKEEEKGLDGNADENLDAEAISLKKQKRNYLLDAHVEKNTTANTNTNTNQYDTKNEKRNYLGLEIRSSVAFYARERIPRRDLNGIIDFVGCNANVDLDRLLTSYTNGGGGDIALISVQYPDPHFKKQHQKRRVLTPEFINTMAKFLKPGREVFIQSDIKDVFDTMRLSIREDGSEYFTDDIEDIEEYMEYNPIGVPTERETSVLDQGLPVYRTVFRRKDVKYSE